MKEPSLRLRKLVASNKPARAKQMWVAGVLVDTGVFHLDAPFDYLVPEEFSSSISEGSLVQIPFHGRTLLGVVTNRSEREEYSQLSFITKNLSEFPLLTPETLALITKSAHRYAASFWEIFSEAIPPRVQSVEQLFFETSQENKSNLGTLHRRSRILKPVEPYHEQIATLVANDSKSNQVLVIVPDEKDIDLIAKALEERFHLNPVILSSSLPKSDRYRNFLHVLRRAPQVIIGTRNAVFAPLQPGSTILVYNDGEESLTSPRFPGWSVRDIALLRSDLHSIHFVGYTPTLEILRLCNLGWMESAPTPQLIKIKSDTELGFNQRFIKEALVRGSVLITVASAGYVDSFSCQKCRNRALCSCGGRLYIDKARKYSCSLCELTYHEWKCAYCQESTIRALKRGSERYLEELGRAHPGISIINSTSKHPVRELPPGQHLVLATLGCEPVGSYETVILMDGEYLFNRAGIHGDESVRRHWFGALALMREGGTALVSLPSDHPVVQAMTKWSLSPQIEAELHERELAHLPPFTRLVTIFGPTSEISQIRSVFSTIDLFTHISQRDQQGAFSSDSLLILRSPIEKSDELSDFFYDFNRLRSLKSLPHVKVRLDPFEV